MHTLTTRGGVRIVGDKRAQNVASRVMTSKRQKRERRAGVIKSRDRYRRKI